MGSAAAHEDQSPHVEYRFTVNYMINEGAPLYSEQVALRTEAEMTSSCGDVKGGGGGLQNTRTRLHSAQHEFLFLNAESSIIHQARHWKPLGQEVISVTEFSFYACWW